MNADLLPLKPPVRRLPLILAVTASLGAHALLLAVATLPGQTLRLPAQRQVLNLSLETAAQNRPDSVPGKQAPTPTPRETAKPAHTNRTHLEAVHNPAPPREPKSRRQQVTAKQAPRPQPIAHRSKVATAPQSKAGARQPRKSDEQTAAKPSQPAATGSEAAEPTPLHPPAYRGPTLHNPQPEYPFLARRRGLEGTVLLRVRVSTGGAPLKVFIVHSSGADILDQAAVRAVSQWQFIPAHRGDERLEATVEVPVRFELRNG